MSVILDALRKLDREKSWRKKGTANIAVEIPEAPHGGTLYRLLFLAAVLLFIFTFLINTVAELVRQRLRTKYSQY